MRNVPGPFKNIGGPARANGFHMANGIGIDDLMPRVPVTRLLEYLRASGQIIALENSN